jgi:hypothetical protein
MYCGLGLVLQTHHGVPAGSAFLVTDRQQRISAVSTVAEQQLGLGEPELLGRPVTDLALPARLLAPGVPCGPPPGTLVLLRNA